MYTEWSIGYNDDKGAPFHVYIQSEDFTHDVRLYVNGDFKNVDDAMLYAQKIADKLNVTKD